MQIKPGSHSVKFNTPGYALIIIVMLMILAVKIFSQLASPARNETLELIADLLFATTFISAIVVCFRKFEEYVKSRDEEQVRLFCKSPHPMWIYDVQTLRFVAVNDAAVALYGYSEEEFMALTLKDIRCAEDVPALMSSAEKARSNFTHDYHWSGVWRHKLKSGQLEYVEISTYEMIFWKKKCKLVMAYKVTERVLQDQKLNAMNQELEQKVMDRTNDLLLLNKQLIDQNRIIKSANLELFTVTSDLKEANKKIREQADLKNKFISMASHEFRTPLANISCNAKVLKKNMKELPAKEVTYRISDIQKQVDHLFCVLDDVLTLGKDESGKLKVNLQELNIEAFVSKIVEEVMNASGGTHKIMVNMHEATPLTVASDRNFLRNIFINLLNNAIKYSPGKDQVFLDIYPDRNTISFEIRDTGIGISSDETDKIFEPFFRSQNTDGIQGTGLGLSIVKRAADLLNASIHVKSEPGKGSTFRVILPVQEIW